GDSAQNQRYRLCAGWVALIEGNLPIAYRELDAAVPTQNRGGSLRISLWAQAWLARVQFLQGDWDSALSSCSDGIRRAEHAGMGLLLPLLEWTVREIQLWRGEEPNRAWWQATGISQFRGYSAMQVPARMIRAIECRVKGDYEGVLTALLPLDDIDPWTTEQASFWHWQPELIHALVIAERLEEADQLAQQYDQVTAQAPDMIRATVYACNA